MTRRYLTGIAAVCVLLLPACTYQAGYNPTYLPREQPRFLSADEVLLLMTKDEEDYVYSGNPHSFTGGATTLEMPLGFILKEVAQSVLADRFSGGVDFANTIPPEHRYLLVLHPSIREFDYSYNQLKNLGFAITPEVNIALDVEILDNEGHPLFEHLYQPGKVSGSTYILSGSPAEKVNQVVHRTLFDLLAQSFDDARPVVVDYLQHQHGRNPDLAGQHGR